MWTIARLFLLPVLVSLRISPSKRRGATHEKDTRMGFFCGALSSRKKRPGWWIQTTGRFDGVSQKFVFHVFSVLFFWGGEEDVPNESGFQIWFREMMSCFFASRLSPPSKNSVVPTQILKHFVLWSLITSVAIYGSEKRVYHLPIFHFSINFYLSPELPIPPSCYLFA